MFERKVLQEKIKFENDRSGIYSNFPSKTSAGKVSTFYQRLSKTLHVALQALQALAPSPSGSPLPRPMCFLPFVTDPSLNSPHSFSPLLINFEKLFSSFQARFKNVPPWRSCQFPPPSPRSGNIVCLNPCCEHTLRWLFVNATPTLYFRRVETGLCPSQKPVEDTAHSNA